MASSSPDQESVEASTAGPLVGFCGMHPYYGEDQPDADCSASGDDTRAFAVVRSGSVWKGRQVLSVCFLNPEVLEGWGLTTDTIIEWANAWEEVVGFKKTESTKKADIRVECSEKEVNWSVIGMEADKLVKHPKPTMVLNLKLSDDICDSETQKSLVIHEFGHALGLEHEHQRSDFWDGVEKHIDLGKMKDDNRVKESMAKKGKASFGANWLKTDARKFLGISKSKPDVTMSPYDPESIMHYGFDKDWLTNVNHRDPRTLRQDKNLSAEEKIYIGGILKRHSGLAKGPSKIDLCELRRAYGDKGCTCGSHQNS